jgi:hypothetical protein
MEQKEQIGGTGDGRQSGLVLFGLRFYDSLVGLLLDPLKFLEKVTTSGSYGGASAFLACVSCVHALPLALSHGKPFELIPDFAGGFSMYVILSVFLFLLSKVFKGAGGFKATYIVCAYSAAPKVVTWLPAIGWIFGLYGVYLQFVGIKSCQKLSNGKAACVVLIPVAISLGLGFIAATIKKYMFGGAP